MQIIKKIIAWLISLFRNLFTIKKEKVTVSRTSNNITVSKKKNQMVNFSSNETMPSYMMITNEEKSALINKLLKLKHELKQNNDNTKLINKIVALLEESDYKGKNKDHNIAIIQSQLQDLNKVDLKKINSLLTNYDEVAKESVEGLIKNNLEQNRIIKEGISNIDEILEYVNKNNISLETNNMIDSIVDEFPSEKSIIYNKDIINKIKHWDKSIIDKVKLDYQKVNYVTVSTHLIDTVIDEYKRLEDDYKNHRYNKYYYEKRINKIKEQINHLMTIKNTSSVSVEIEQLRKELYTKSKDKYDVLYNNEIFMNINRRCDELLDKVNQKVVDIKKDTEKKVQIEEKERKKREYLEKIMLRFQDLNLSRELILLYLENQKKAIKTQDILSFIESADNEFLNGVNGNFNYQRNKTKTELVKYYNDLNMALAHTMNQETVFIDHINFRMADLIDAVVVKREEVNSIITSTIKKNNDDLVDERIANIEKTYLEKREIQKVLKNRHNSPNN